MGLDISAYSKIKQEKHGDIYIGRDEFGTRPDLSDGEYTESDDSVYHGFRAGSYSGYNRWRENLSMAIHGVMPSIIWNSPEKYSGKEFFEIKRSPEFTETVQFIENLMINLTSI